MQLQSDFKVNSNFNSKVVPVPSQNVYACFFPMNITEDEVKSMFEKYGCIKIFQLFKRNDGFTYSHITFETIEQASYAIAQLNCKKIGDKILKVNFRRLNCERKLKKQKKQRVSLICSSIDSDKESKKQTKFRKIREKLIQKDKTSVQVQTSFERKIKKADPASTVKQKEKALKQENNVDLFLSWLKQRNHKTEKLDDEETGEIKDPYIYEIIKNHKQIFS